MVKLEGAEVISVEGLGMPENPHFIQEAFVLAGAVQCGFCTPGMIMATKALLDKNPDPSVEQIKKALAHNLCRCTGYTKIIEAARLAGRFLRRETTPEAVKARIEKGMLGVSHPRPTAMLKACGLAQFNDDIPMPEDTIEIAVVRSTIPHGIIKSVDTTTAEKMPGVVGILRAKDIKGPTVFARSTRTSRCFARTRFGSSAIRLSPWPRRHGSRPEPPRRQLRWTTTLCR